MRNVGIYLEVAGLCEDCNTSVSAEPLFSLALIVGGQSAPPCCCATPALPSFTAPVSEKTQDVDKRDHSSSREVVGMNEIPRQ